MSKPKSSLDCDFDFESTYKNDYSNSDFDYPTVGETNYGNKSDINEEIKELSKFCIMQQKSIYLQNKSISKFQDIINRFEEKIIKLESKLISQENTINELKKTINSMSNTDTDTKTNTDINTDTKEEYNFIDFKNCDFNKWDKIKLSDSITRYNLKDRVGEYVNYKIINDKIGNPMFCNVSNNTRLKLVFNYSLIKYEIEPSKNYTFTY